MDSPNPSEGAPQVDSNEQNKSPPNIADGHRRAAQNNQGSPRNSMSGFISFIFSTFLFVVAFAFFIVYVTKGTYAGYKTALIWGIVSFIFAGGALVSGYLYYVLNPSKTAEANAPPPADRPWLNVEVIPAGPITYSPQQGELAAFFPVKFRITNAGHSPSSEIQLKAEVFFARFKEDPRERQRKIVSWKGHPFQPGVVFPSTPVENTITWVKPISEMKKAGINPSVPTIEQVTHWGAYIGGCISYTYGAGFPGETGFLYEVNVRPAGTPGNPYSGIVPETGKDIPLNQLAFYRYLRGGGEWAK